MEKKNKKPRGAGSGSRCIICGEARDGLEVREDRVIRAMRYFKQNVTKNAKNYRLVVCRACYPKYDKYRSTYVKKQVSYVVVAVIFAALLIIVSGGQPSAFAYGIAIIIFMYLLSLLSYTPAVNLPPGAKPPAAKGRKQPA